MSETKTHKEYSLGIPKFSDRGRSLAEFGLMTIWPQQLDLQSRVEGSTLLVDTLSPAEIAILDLSRKGLRGSSLTSLLRVEKSVIDGVVRGIKDKTGLENIIDLVFEFDRENPPPSHILEASNIAVRGLTWREKGLIDFLAIGEDRLAQLAQFLGFAERTVGAAQHDAAEKLGVESNALLLGVIGRRAIRWSAMKERPNDAATIQLTQQDASLIYHIGQGNSLDKTAAHFDLDSSDLEQIIAKIIQKMDRTLSETCVVLDTLRPAPVKKELRVAWVWFDRLSQEEKATARLIVAGMQNQEIATKRQESIDTIEVRRKDIMKSLGVPDSVELLAVMVSRSDRYESYDEKMTAHLAEVRAKR